MTEELLTDPIERLERMLAQRHANLVDAVSVRLDRTEQLVLTLYKEITDHALRVEEITALRADLDALTTRVAALELRPACALMAT